MLLIHGFSLFPFRFFSKSRLKLERSTWLSTSIFTQHNILTWNKKPARICLYVRARWQQPSLCNISVWPEPRALSDYVLDRLQLTVSSCKLNIISLRELTTYTEYNRYVHFAEFLCHKPMKLGHENEWPINWMGGPAEENWHSIEQNIFHFKYCCVFSASFYEVSLTVRIFQRRVFCCTWMENGCISLCRFELRKFVIMIARKVSQLGASNLVSW